MYDGQITPGRYSNLNSYVKNLCALSSGWTDRKTKKLIQNKIGRMNIRRVKQFEEDLDNE
jgi:hypothetical protein